MSDDEILYNYQAMDHAFEEMLRVNGQIHDSAQTLEADAKVVLQGMAGAVIDGYESRFKTLLQKVEDSNTYLKEVAKGLQAGFDSMRHTDIKLGDGMG